MYNCGTNTSLSTWLLIHMFYIRTTKTASGSTAVQVVRYENRRKIIAVHIGSAHTPQELLSLKQTAQTWIKKTTEQQSLLTPEKNSSHNSTLYFESFEPDELRKCGFSKDNKFNQPQVLIGLMVNPDGFPVAYEIFEGNKFEGHTLIPVISAFKKRHQIKSLTIVADAAMLSQENMEGLQANGFHYIVGARLANLSQSFIKDISSKLKQIDVATIKVNTPHGSLVCDFSGDRFRKDKHEMEKQILKAQVALTNTTHVKRLKFLKQQNQTNYELNTATVEKTTSLLGIKGYYTNLSDEVDDSTIINYYHQLWQVEQTFRMAKSDLEMRPIYHFKKYSIEVHILICFMALSISKFLEIKTGKSIKSIIRSLKNVTDARIFNKLTKKEIILRSEIKDDVKDILQKLDLWY